MTHRAHKLESFIQDGSANQYAGQCSLCRIDVAVGAGVLRSAGHRKLHLVCQHCDGIETPPIAERLAEVTGDVTIAGRQYSRNRWTSSCTDCGSLVPAGEGVAVKPHARARWRVKCRYCVEVAA